MKQPLIITLLFALLWIAACDSPHDLEAVSGIGGRIEFIGQIPDSIKAISLVVLETEAVNDQSNIGKYLVSYSDPINQASDYYIQLKPGHYMGVLVGLLIDPGLFVANIDSYLVAPDLPLVQITQDPVGLFIQEGKTFYFDWEAEF